MKDYENYWSGHRSMAGVAAYQTFNKEIMHETINKTIPDEHVGSM
ncbi:5005_t:CDS:2 [Entrophospora sp. SA101]|nr:5005_t:CDS:2 [Entrophospora sp. SA101]